MPVVPAFLDAHPDVRVEIAIDAPLTDIVATRYDAGIRWPDKIEKDMVAVTVGPPIDLTVYARDELHISRYRRFDAKDHYLRDIQTRWEQALRKGVQELPEVRFGDPAAEPPRSNAIDRTADAGLTERAL